MFGDGLSLGQRAKWLGDNTMILIAGGSLNDKLAEEFKGATLAEHWAIVVTIAQDKLAEGINSNHPFGYQFDVGSENFEEAMSRAYAIAYGLVNKGLGFVSDKPQ